MRLGGLVILLATVEIHQAHCTAPDITSIHRVQVIAAIPAFKGGPVAEYNLILPGYALLMTVPGSKLRSQLFSRTTVRCRLGI